MHFASLHAYTLKHARARAHTHAEVLSSMVDFDPDAEQATHPTLWLSHTLHKHTHTHTHTHTTMQVLSSMADFDPEDWGLPAWGAPAR